MKINLELELDWIQDEEMTIDEAVKQHVIDNIVSKLGAKITENVEEKVNTKIDEMVLDKVNELTDKMFYEFLEREISITDKWGSEVMAYPKLEDLIKEKFDNFMDQKVDQNGKPADRYSSTKQSRIVYVIDKQLKEMSDKFTTDAVKTVREEIKQHVEQGLTQKLGTELMKVLKVENLLTA